MSKIRVVTAVVAGDEQTKDHDGDKWHVTDNGVLTITSDRNGVEASYPDGGWMRVERIQEL